MPKPLSGTLAPVGVLPLTVSLVVPFALGSVFSAAARALMRPEPKILLGAGLPRGAALFKIRSRSVVLAVTWSRAPMAPLSRQGAASRSSAATPAACGVAAELPKNGFSKLPAPVTETPSIPLTSGLVRPSTVGPLLLKNSMVECVVSLQPEGFTKAALKLAEQSAPTEVTLTGEPPASDSAGTLLLGVL